MKKSIIIILLVSLLFFSHYVYSQPSAQDIADILEIHNNNRTFVCSNPLVWDNTVASVAQNWANRCVFQHSSGSGYGENIAAGSYPAYTARRLSILWADEIRDYRCGGGFGSAGHYTQMVWSRTVRIGCGLRNCGGGVGNFLVCNYDPPGNYLGQDPYTCPNGCNGSPPPTPTPSPATTGPLTTGRITTGRLTTGELTTGELTTGSVTTRLRPATTSPVTTREITTSPITTQSPPVTTRSPPITTQSPPITTAPITTRSPPLTTQARPITTQAVTSADITTEAPIIGDGNNVEVDGGNDGGDKIIGMPKGTGIGIIVGIIVFVIIIIVLIVIIIIVVVKKKRQNTGKSYYRDNSSAIVPMAYAPSNPPQSQFAYLHSSESEYIPSANSSINGSLRNASPTSSFNPMSTLPPIRGSNNSFDSRMPPSAPLHAHAPRSGSNPLFSSNDNPMYGSSTSPNPLFRNNNNPIPKKSLPSPPSNSSFQTSRAPLPTSSNTIRPSSDNSTLRSPPSSNSNRRLPGPPPAKNSRVQPFQVGTMCQAIYSGDGQFYRARIDEINGNQYKVAFVDFNDDSEWVSKQALKMA